MQIRKTLKGYYQIQKSVRLVVGVKLNPENYPQGEFQSALRGLFRHLLCHRLRMTQLWKTILRISLFALPLIAPFFGCSYWFVFRFFISFSRTNQNVPQKYDNVKRKLNQCLKKKNISHLFINSSACRLNFVHGRRSSKWFGGAANFCPKNDLMHCVSLSKLRRFFLPKLRCSPKKKKKRSSLRFERFFQSKWRCSPKKKKGLPWDLNGFSSPNEGVLQKKKKKRSSPKLRRYFGTSVPKYPDYLPK